MAVATSDRVALYLQDKHPIRDGMRYAQLAEAAGFETVWQAESRLVREATVPMAAYAAVTERIGDRLRGRQHLDAERRPARGDVLDARRPGPGARQARPRRLVGAARVEGGCEPAPPAAGDAGDGRGHAAPARHGARHLPRRVRPPRRRRDRHRPRRPLAEARPDLRRRDRDEDDGARRRGRRRRPPQLPGRTGLQPSGDGGARRGRCPRVAAPSTTSTAPSSSSARWTRTDRSRSTARGSWSPSTSASSRTS